MARVFMSYSYDPAEGDALRAWLEKRLAGVDVTAAMREVAEWVILVPSPDVEVFPETATAHATVPTPTIRTSFTASGSLPAEPKRSLIAGLSPGQIYAIALIWVIAYVLPIWLYSQSPTPSTLVEGNLATCAFAFEITCRILDKRK